MTDATIFTDEHVKEAEQYDNLGPSYFAAREIARRYMENFASEQFEPLIKEFTDKFRDKLWGDVDTFLISDTESNLQGTIWRMVDEVVRGLLGGKQWMLKRYALGDRYDCDELRAAVAKHIPKELQDARVGDLEAEVAYLKEQLKWERGRI